MRGFADESVLSLVENPDVMARGRLQVQFHLFPIKDARRSAEEGRPIFEQREFVRIYVPGDKDNVVDREVEDADRRRFAREYDAWKRGLDAPTTGTPLSQWPAVDRAQVAELEFFHVRTVEELASLADNHASRFRGINDLRQKARDYLAAAQGQAPIERLRYEVAAKETEADGLRTQVEELKTQLRDALSELKRVKKAS
jgi:hypothetical protein